MRKFVLEIDIDNWDYQYNTLVNISTTLLTVVTKLHQGVPEYSIFSPHSYEKVGTFKIVEETKSDST